MSHFHRMSGANSTIFYENSSEGKNVYGTAHDDGGGGEENRTRVETKRDENERRREREDEGENVKKSRQIWDETGGKGKM